MSWIAKVITVIVVMIIASIVFMATILHSHTKSDIMFIRHLESGEEWVATDVEFKNDRIEFTDQTGKRVNVGICYIYWEER